jgi:CRP/FNR family transcriptional regulator, cyclic AMP receptor protein
MLKKNKPAGDASASPGSALDKVPLLASLTPAQRERLSKEMTARTLAPGESAVVEGRHGVGFFIITSGTADVVIHGEKKQTLGPGDYFGEMAMLSEGGTRSATVVAETELHYLAMAAWNFKPFLREHPEISWEIMSTMAKRLSDNT